MNDDNVVELPVVTRLDLDADRVLEKAKGKLKTVLVLGETKGDGEEYFAASAADGPENLWLLARAGYKLMKIVDEAAEN